MPTPDSLSVVDELSNTSHNRFINNGISTNYSFKTYNKTRRNKNKFKMLHKELTSQPTIPVPRISISLAYTQKLIQDSFSIIRNNSLLKNNNEISVQENQDQSLVAPLLLAAGHMNKFFLYSNKYGQSCYILKVTSPREGQFYTLLYKLAGLNLKSYSSIVPLFGKENVSNILNENDLYDSLNNLSYTKNHLSKLIFSIANDFSISPTLLLGKSNSNNTYNSVVTNISKDQIFAKVFLKFIPKCYKIYSHNILAPDESNSSKTYLKELNIIKLINLNFNLKLPLILDIKMGRRLYGDDASQIKKERLQKKAIGRSVESLGFSFSGMIGYNFKEEPLKIYGGSRCFDDNNKGNPQTIDQYSDIVFYRFLCTFRSPILSIKVGQFLCNQIESILEIMEEQNLVTFYGSSLLFVGDTSITENANLADFIKVRMIDFANVTLNSGKKDLDYIFGLKNLLIALKQSIKNFQ